MLLDVDRHARLSVAPQDAFVELPSTAAYGRLRHFFGRAAPSRVEAGAECVTAAGLREQHEAVPELAYRRFHLGQWTERESYWLPAGAWQRITGTPVFTEGEEITVGLDVGGTRSTTAVVWLNDSYQVGVEIYHGDEGVLEAKETIQDLARRYRIRALAYDPWRSGQLAEELRAHGILAVSSPQTESRLIPASQRLYEAVVQGRLTVPDHEELRQQVANTIASTHAAAGESTSHLSTRLTTA